MQTANVPVELLDEICESLQTTNQADLKYSLKNDDHRVRCSLFSGNYVLQIFNICQRCHFDYSIMCYAIEFCERIFDRIVKTFLREPERESLRPIIDFNIQNSFEIFNLKLCKKLFQRFFYSSENRATFRVLNRLNPLDSNSYCETCFHIFAHVSLSCAIKLLDKQETYNEKLHYLKKERSFPNIELPKRQLANRFFIRIENYVYRFLRFNLHVTSINVFTDAILSLPLLDCSFDSIRTIFSSLFATFYRYRFAMSKHIFYAAKTDNLAYIEYFFSDKIFFAYAILICGKYLQELPNENLDTWIINANIHHRCPRIIIICFYLIKMYHFHHHFQR